MTDDDFSLSLHTIMKKLASDVEAGLLDEKPTERVAAIKTLQQYDAFRARKNKGQKPPSGLDAYRRQIAGEATEGDNANGNVRN